MIQVKVDVPYSKVPERSVCKQGSDLIDLRLIWRELENLIFKDFWRHS